MRRMQYRTSSGAWSSPSCQNVHMIRGIISPFFLSTAVMAIDKENTMPRQGCSALRSATRCVGRATECQWFEGSCRKQGTCTALAQGNCRRIPTCEWRLWNSRAKHRRCYPRRVRRPAAIDAGMRHLYAAQVRQLNAPLLGATRVAPSGLGPDAGWGLFANRPFSVGDTVAVMDGVLVDDAAVQRLPVARRTYLRTLLHNVLHLNGLRQHPPPVNAGHGSYANDGNGPQKSRNNTVFRMVRTMQGLLPVCTLVATRPIAIGEEILVSYGNQYWRRHRRA